MKLTTGGSTQDNIPQNNIYHLPSENEDWYIMENRLSQSRANHIAFLIPGAFMNCPV